MANVAALKLYERLGFVKVDRMSRYYLSGTDAFVLRRPLFIDTEMNSHLLASLGFEQDVS